MRKSDSVVSTSFRENGWRSQPFRFDYAPIAVDPEIFSLDYIQEMIDGMEPDSVIFREAGIEPDGHMARLVNPDFAGTDLRRVLCAGPRSLMLSDVHAIDPAYGDVLRHFVSWVAEALGIRPARILHPSASLFLSSPDAVSCYHTDREQNVLVQLIGHKCVHVFPRTSSISKEVLFALFRSRKGIHFEYAHEMEANCQLFDLGESNALYIPRLWPHWVANGPEISVSVSLNFFTSPSFILERMYNLGDRARAIATRRFKRLSNA